MHGRVLQYRAHEATVLLGDVLGEARANRAASQGELRRRGRVVGDLTAGSVHNFYNLRTGELQVVKVVL